MVSRHPPDGSRVSQGWAFKDPARSGRDASIALPGSSGSEGGPGIAPSTMAPLLGNRLGHRFALVENVYHDVARRLVAEVLLSVDDAAGNVVALAGLEHEWRLSLDGEGHFALLDRSPLIAGVAMEFVAGTGRHGDGYHLYCARRVFLQGRHEISDGLARWRRLLGPCGGREHAGGREHCNDR